MLFIKSPAKLNLFLEVVAKRSDGYHDIDSVFVTIDLSDRLGIQFTPGDGIEVITDNPAVPDGEDNIIYKAIDGLIAVLNKPAGIKVLAQKVIPVGGGMGGGSSNAAAVILALCNYWKEDYNRPEIVRLARSLGADVPFFLYGNGFARCQGIGDEIYPIKSDKDMFFVVVNPNLIINTGQVYRSIDLTYDVKSSKILMGTVSNDRGSSAIRDCLFNRMEEAVLKLYPVIGEIKRDLLDAGCIASLMSGSGSSVFGLAQDEYTAKRIVDNLRQKHPDWFLVATKRLHHTFSPKMVAGTGDNNQ